MMRSVFWSALVFLAACQSLPATNPASPYYQIPAGSQLVLHQAVTIPAHTAHVFIQGGQLLAPRRLNPVNQYYPNCKLEVRQPADRAQTIAPDTFIVTRVSQNWYDAGLVFPLYASVGDDDGPSMQNYITTLFLHSERQPQVWRLDCQHWQYPAEAEFLTLAQIRQTLGNVMSVELAK